MKNYIYGIFDSQKFCHYIGQTKTPEKREYSHVKSPNAKYHGLIFLVIRTCGAETVDKLERQIGLAYQRKGQAQGSRKFHVEMLAAKDSFRTLRGANFSSKQTCIPLLELESLGCWAVFCWSHSDMKLAAKHSLPVSRIQAVREAFENTVK